MMETITQNCALYLAHKLALYNQLHRSRSWRVGHVEKGKRIVRKPRGQRRFHLQEDKGGLCADRFLLL